MCIRDRVSTQSTWVSNFNKQYMSCSSGDECKAVSVKFSNTGSVSATYGLGSTLREEYLQITSGSHRLLSLSLIHISEPTRPLYISYAVFCLKKKKKSKHLL
eukprot:TRINITY_DN62488_c0_g1_i1.p1 TRINITY_DN62488_c0_g1~~TRINITY_DN62488_c0_g1_i1.p1  ORF type:complete len:102 (+),score=27.14 TRINITY_DN62488_c0_g1_i1:121-426(+)